MKKAKKIGLGLLVAAVLFGLSSFLFNPKVSAAYTRVVYQGNSYYSISNSGVNFGRPSAGGSIVSTVSNESDCYGGAVVILDSVNAKTGKFFRTADNPLAFPASQPLNVVAAALSGNCFTASFEQKVDIDGNGNGTAQAQNAVVAPTQEEIKTCEANLEWSLTWLVCPVLKGADWASGAFNSFVEKQLCFKTGDSNPNRPGIQSSTNGVVCEGKNYLNDKVKTNWSIFARIATALLVIVMLVAIISQALGFESGPLDAYTIRKILPKLVAAVILIQISWYLFKYAIDLSNDAGYAIKDLMFAPFGGSDNVDLAKLVGHNVSIATDKVGENAFGLFFIIAGVVSLYYIIPALPLLALYVILALLVAFLVLLFRKILIVLLVILAPLAFIAWLLPGTEKYWKLWRENFIKLVFMFPLVMALLASGRIFAYITGSDTVSSGGVTDFATLAIIVGAWFAPYFLLPKTFSWGGSMFGAVAGAVNKGVTNASRKPREYLKETEKGWREQRKRDSMERVAQGHPRKFTSLDMFRSGAWNPLLGVSPEAARRMGLHKVPGIKNAQWAQEGSRRRNRQMRSYVEQGEKSEHEYEQAAEAALIRERQKHRAIGGDHDLYLQAIADGRKSYYDPGLGDNVELGIRSKADRMAARRQLAKLGAGMNWRYLQDYHDHTMESGSDEEKAEMRKFFDDNVDTILPKMPHIYKSIGQAADADPSTIAGMHGVAIETVLANLNRDIRDPSRGGKIKDTAEQARIKSAAQANLSRFMGNFQRAVENSERGGPQLESGALRAVHGYLTGNQDVLDDINMDPVHGRQAPFRATDNPRLPVGDKRRPAPMPDDHVRTLVPVPDSHAIEPAMAPELQQEIEGFRQTLGAKIDPSGVVRSAPPAGAPVPGVPGGPGPAPGVLIVPHQRVEEADLDVPDASGWTPRADAYAENASRTEYNDYRDRIRRGDTLTPDEERRYNQIRNSYPDW